MQDAQPPQPASASVIPLDTTAPVLLDRPLVLPVRLATIADESATPDRWLRQVTIRTDQGTPSVAQLRYMGIATDPTLAPKTELTFATWGWTAPVFSVVELSPDDAQRWFDAADPGRLVQPLVVVPNPIDFPAALHLGARRVRLVAVKPPMRDPGLVAIDRRSKRLGDWSYPDARSPWESFRRALYALDRHSPEDPPLDELATFPELSAPVDALYGSQLSGLWLRALEDLARIDPLLHRRLTDSLLNTIWDQADIVAAWPTRAEDLADLDRILMLRYLESLDDADWTGRIRLWLQRQPATLHWIENDAGPSVELASANLSSEFQIVTVGWNDQPRIGANVLRLDPRQIARTTFSRPDRSNDVRLLVQSGGSAWPFAVSPPSIEVLPPGWADGRFERAWNLSTWYTLSPALSPTQPTPLNRLTITRDPQSDHWQIQVRARIASPRNHGDDDKLSLDRIGHWARLVGHEAITILIGPHDDPLLALSARPDGSWVDWKRSGLVSASQIEISSDEQSWTLTFDLPDRLDRAPTIDVGVLRSMQNREDVFGYPRAPLPWRANPGRRRFDLTIWDPLPIPFTDQ